MSTAYYYAPIYELATFNYFSANILTCGDYQDNRYFFSPDSSVQVPTSPVAQFTEITLTQDVADYIKLFPLCPVKYILTLQDAKNSAISLLQEYMWGQILQGFTFTSTASSMSFPVSIKSAQDIVNINGLSTLAIVMKQNLGADASFPLIFIDANGGVNNPTPDDAISLGHQCGQFVIKAYNWFAPLQTQILQASTIDSINDILTGSGLQSLYS